MSRTCEDGRVCRDCSTYKDSDQFYKKVTKGGRTYLNSRCKQCHNAYTKAHYAAEPATYKDRAATRKKGLRQWLRGMKSQLKCNRCGEDHPATLDFHHRYGPKSFSLAKVGTYGWGHDKIEEELDKCEVLCANCHRKEHFADFYASSGGPGPMATNH